MRDAFVKTLIQLATDHPEIELLTGDLGFGVLKPFFETVPNQFTNVGIAEQNMLSMAAGMAMMGKTVFVYSIGNFPTLRCLEQIRNDCAYHHANVKIVCVGGGFAYGSLGVSHHATEDIAIMRALPNVLVVCPGDLMEAMEATKAIAKHEGTVYLRLGRGGEKRVHDALPDFEIGKAILVHKPQCDGKTVALFSSGSILNETKSACTLLEEAGIGVAQYSFPFVSPIDRETIVQCAKNHTLIATVEEGNVTGGFGSAVSEVLADEGVETQVLRMGLQNEYCSLVGTQGYLRAQYGLDAQSMATNIHRMMAHA